MAYGDLDAEQPHSLSETNFTRLFRLAQLTVEYLLHVQDRLVWENGLLKARTHPLAGAAAPLSSSPFATQSRKSRMRITHTAALQGS